MNYILIGMPASGKSTVGVVLAKQYGMDFADTDLIIQQNEKMLLQEIIDKHGINALLEAEERALLSVNGDNMVIATGGSAVYSELGMAKLKSLGKIIYLQLPYRLMLSRLNNIRTRGVVLKNGETLAHMYEERVPLYEKYADITVNCAVRRKILTVEEIIQKICFS